MNLQTTYNQNVFIVPFTFGNFSNKSRKTDLTSNYLNQKKEALEDEKIEPKQKDNLVLSNEVISIIGFNGKNRFDEFKNYPDKWYGGKGKKLSNWSVSIFERFVKNLPKLKVAKPSLFLTLEGNLSLGFEDKDGKSIEIEFHPDKIEYYIENSNEESHVKLSDTHLLIEKIKNLLK